MSDAESWRSLLDGVLGEVDAITDESLAAIREALPVYRRVDPGELRESLRTAFLTILTAARDRGLEVDDAQLGGLAGGGRHRAANGVPADEMLLAWRIGFQVTVAHARNRGERDGITAEQLLDLLQSLIAWSDRGMVVVAAAHNRAELDFARADQEARSDFVRSALLGTIAPQDLGTRAAELGLDPGREYVAIRATVPQGMSVAEVRRVVGFGETVGDHRGQSALVDGHVAGFLPELHSRAETVVIGAGPSRDLHRIAESFTAATRALETALAFGLSGVNRFDDMGLLPAIAADEAVGQRLVARYVAPLNDEVAHSVRTWLAAGMHVARAAEELHVHANTLRYRLGRFEELTGFSLRDPRVQFEAWWALQYAKLGLGQESKQVRP